MKSLNFGYLGAIDQIRGVAALWITAYHYYVFAAHYFVLDRVYSGSTPPNDFWIWTYNPLHSFVATGHTAVSLFMVLSGFIFTYGVGDRTLVYSAFMKNRILRVYPLWIVLILLGLNTTATGVDFLTLIEAIIPVGIRPNVLPWTPFTAMHWSLVIEFQFYLLFPLLIAASQKVGVYKFLTSILCCLLLLRLIAIGLGADSLKLAYYSIAGRLDQFILGMLLATFYASGFPSKQFAKIALPILLLLALVVMMYVTKLGLTTGKGWMQSFRMTLEGVTWALIIGCYLRLTEYVPRLIKLVFEKLGEISFSIYMLHIAVLWLFVIYNPWIRLGLGVNLDLIVNFFALVLPCVLTVAYLSFNTFEKPFLMLRVQYFKP